MNPARSIGPALFSGWWSIVQLPLFIIAPVIGAVGAGLLFKSGMLDAPADAGGDDGDAAGLRSERDALMKERDQLAADLKDCRATSASISAATAAAASATAATAPVAAPASTAPASKPEGLSAPRGGVADDLKQINGVGPSMEKLLNSLGYYHFDQVASWTPAELAWVDDNLEGFKGRATRDNWSAQAKTLARG